MGRFTSLLTRYRKTTLATLCAIGVLAVVRMVSNPFSSSLTDILPLEEQSIAEQYRFLDAFRATDQILIELSSEKTGTTFQELATAAHKITDSLLNGDMIRLRSGLDLKAFSHLQFFLLSHWPVLFTQQDSIWLQARLNRDSLAARTSTSLKNLFVLSDKTADAATLQSDPFDFRWRVLTKLAAFRPNRKFFIEDGFITDSSRSRILLLAESTAPSMDGGNARAITELISSVEAFAQFQGIGLRWIGAARASHDNETTIRRDVNRTAPLAFVFIALICALIYRNRRYGLFTFFPTALGVLISIAAFSLLRKPSIIMLGFSAALLGITVDYAIHFFHFIDSKPEDPDPQRTLRRPIWTSALTTAVAFAALGAGGIPGLTQLGLMTAAGILIVAFLSIEILPAFFPLSMTQRTSLVDMEHLFSKLYDGRIPRFGAVLVILTGVLLWTQVPSLSFDGEPDNLNGMSKAAAADEMALANHWGTINSASYLGVQGNTFQSVLNAVHDRLDPLVQELSDSGLIESVATVGSLLPPVSQQKENYHRWHSFWTQENTSLARNAFDSVATEFGIPTAPFVPYFAALDSTHTPFSYDDLPEGFREGMLSAYVRQSGGTWYVGVPIFRTGAWQTIGRKAKNQGVLAVNESALAERLMAVVKSGFSRTVVLIPLLIIVVLALLLRQFRLVLTAVCSVWLSTGLTLGAMAILGIPLNLVSLMVLAFVFGLGIDYAIVMLHLGDTNKKGSLAGFALPASSVSIAAVTTLAGLGIMLFAKHPVLRILGATGLLGIITSFIVALLFTPVFSQFLKRANQNKTEPLS